MRTRLGHYDIVSELGRGGMGVVYKGYEGALGRYVAIKVLADALANDVGVRERFLREARSMAALNDPHIIQIYAIGDDEGQTYFVMEFVEGESLASLLRREQKVAVGPAARIIHQTALGLATAHDAGVIHRDIKPGNLMLSNRGMIKVADFGIALSHQDLQQKLTMTGEFVGTPGYLSPDVCLGKPVDRRSDIFSLGVVFFQLLTGRMPFTDESPLGMMLEVVRAEIPDVRELNGEVDEDISSILGRMVAKEPGDRFASCHLLAAELARHPLVAGGGTISLVPRMSEAAATMVLPKTPVAGERGYTDPPKTPSANPLPATRVATAAAEAGDAPTELAATATAVDGGTTQRVGATAPTAVAAPVPAATATPATAPRRRRLLLPLAAAAVLLLALLVGGGAWALRSFLPSITDQDDGNTLSQFLSGFAGDGELRVNAAGSGEPAAATAEESEAVGAAAQPDESDGEPAGESEPGVEGATGSATPPAGEGAAASSAQPTPAGSAGTSPVAAAPPVQAPSAPRTAAPAPAPVRAPTSFAVAYGGDDAIAVPLRDALVAALQERGLRVVELPGSSSPDADPTAARGRADALLFLSVRPVGSEVLNYYGQSSTVYTVQVSARAYGADGSSLWSVAPQQVMFSALNATAKAQEAADAVIAGLAGRLD